MANDAENDEPNEEVRDRKGAGKSANIETDEERGAGPLNEPGSGKSEGEGADEVGNIGRA